MMTKNNIMIIMFICAIHSNLAETVNLKRLITGYHHFDLLHYIAMEFINDFQFSAPLL